MSSSVGSGKLSAKENLSHFCMEMTSWCWAARACLKPSAQREIQMWGRLMWSRREAGEIREAARERGVRFNRPVWRGSDTRRASGSQLTGSPVEGAWVTALRACKIIRGLCAARRQAPTSFNARREQPPPCLRGARSPAGCSYNHITCQAVAPE